MKLFQVFIVAGVVGALTVPATSEAGPGRLGVMADVGVPDGAMASIVFKPLSIIKLHGGVGYNLIAPGVRVGASVAPPWIISPSINLEAGHYFEGDANKAVNMFGGGGEEGSDSPVLREVGYQYANFHLGFELGGDRVSFYLHAGMSAIRGNVRNLNEELASNEDDEEDGPMVEIRQDPVVNLWVPSARTGFVVFF